MKLMSKTDDEKINQIIYLMQKDKSFDAPADALRWSKNIFLTRAAAPKKSLVERISAVLQMDLSPNRAAFGERSASASEARQMLFQAGDNAVDLRIKQDEKGLNVHGQILGAGFENCSIEIFNDKNSFKVAANELGEFKFAEISDGKYDIRLQKDAKEIVIENLELN